MINFNHNELFSYRMFNLINRELRFDVDVSTWGCGLNAAFYLVVMPEDGGSQFERTFKRIRIIQKYTFRQK